MSRKILLASIFTVVVTAEALAQSSKQKPIIGELQKQLEEMRSQMVKMQNRIAELEAPLPLLVWTSASFGLQLRQCILHPGRQGRVRRFLQILFIFLGDFIVLAFSGERLRHDQV